MPDRALAWRCLSRVALAVGLHVAALAAQDQPVVRLDLAGPPALLLADGRNLVGDLQHAVAVPGLLDLRDERAHVTFGPDPALGITQAQSFTLEMEMRTRRGGFGTVLMCRQGDVVHYSVTIGRTLGHVAFEPWSWQRDKLLSNGRLDDGVWHTVTAVYDKDSGRFGLFVDGTPHAVRPVDTLFAGSPSPSLRLGHNLDPGVQQPFGGEIRRLTLVHGVPSPLLAQLPVVLNTRILSPSAQQTALSAWLAYARRARPPQANSRAEWAQEAQRIRARVQDACGLWPPPYAKDSGRLAGRASPLSGADDAEPTDFVAFKPQLDLAVTEGGTLQRERHSVTRLYWQTFADYFASGWLYRPHPAPSERAPAILCPHGHWQNGARNPVVQSRCIALAQQGYVVLAVDSVHVYDDRIGLSPLSVMTWNNLRGLELLRARTDVDAARIGCTGASGGAQQTYYLTALDCGLAAAAPAVMACHFEDILTEAEVHCACNHTPHLLRAADMPQMAAAFAPRPQFFLTVTGDWTRRFHAHGFPAVRATYQLFGAGDAVSLQQWDKEHAYDQEMREAAYAFFAGALRHQPNAAPKEPDGGVATETVAALDALDRTALRQQPGAIAAEFQTRLMAPRPRAPAAVLRTLRALFESEPPTGGVPQQVRVLALPAGEAVGWSLPTQDGMSLPVLVLHANAAPAATGKASAVVAVLIGEHGKSDVVTERHAEIVDLLQRGVHVVIADVRYVGELDLGKAWRDLYGRMLGLDEGVLAVHDLRRVVASLPALGLPTKPRVAVVGFGDRGAVALFAAALDADIACAAAPDRGSNYRDIARRPLISRILLHADLDDVEALLGTRALVNAAATPAAVAEALR